MSFPLHFPSYPEIVEYLTNHPRLNINSDQKEITKAIVELAAQRFANKSKLRMEVKEGCLNLIVDLIKGVDCYTGKPLPNLRKLGLYPGLWATIAVEAEDAIMDCALSLKIID